MYHRVAFVGCLTGAACLATAVVAEPVPLSGKTLSEIVPGASVHLDTPLGTKLPVKYAANGLISGEAGGLAWFLGSASDRGRWWVADDKLCQKFFKWFDAGVQCLKLKRDGDKLFWSRDDGKTGTATLVAAAPIDEKPFALGHPVSVQVGGTIEERPVDSPPRAVAAVPQPPAPVVKALPLVAPKNAVAVAAPPKPIVAPPTKVAAVATVPPPLKPGAAPSAPKAMAMQSAVPKPIVAKPSTPAAQPPDAQPQPKTEPVSFRVAGVHARDVLNVRQSPSSEAAAVGAIPPFAEGVRLAGQCEMDWCPVTHRGVSGWVNRYYLRQE